MFFQPGARACGGAHRAWLQHNPSCAPYQARCGVWLRAGATPWSSTWRPGPWRCVTIHPIHPVTSVVEYRDTPKSLNPINLAPGPMAVRTTPRSCATFLPTLAS